MTLLYEISYIFYLVVYQFRLIAPYWFAGVIAGAVISTYAGDFIGKLVLSLKGKEKFSPVAAGSAAFLGVVSPLCMYGTVPLIAYLGKNGAPQYLLATFMVSSILLNPNLLLLSFSLGVPIAILRLISSIMAGMLAGLLVKVLFDRKQLFSFECFEEKKKCSSEEKSYKKFISKLNKSILVTAPYFLVGIILTALFDKYFPKSIFVSLFSGNKGLGVLLSASLGVPIYLCGGGTVPLVKAWMNAGMSPGSAIAFMISGPATKLTNLGAVKIILGARNFTFYLAYCIIFAVVTGIIIDAFYGIIQ
ncbi:MAG: permease [Clostridia bacterium]|nr:permease [Clostridia bacterium]